MGWREARGANEASVPNPWGSQFSPTELRHSAFQGSGPLLSRASQGSMCSPPYNTFGVSHSFALC